MASHRSLIDYCAIDYNSRFDKNNKSHAKEFPKTPTNIYTFCTKDDAKLYIKNMSEKYGVIAE